MRGTPGSRG
ncbi:Protein of unknown function [Pyronema omphalodes CBS 100304]|uniref:Uncharacterized protein n=1 Tax=Pyronema omphalodes (strain CBS 100304) TaxID=1076935 RepID=U4L367_PYROM|nr:Protein of unknown function [Pyronema omphalodes CBS 100304]